MAQYIDLNKIPQYDCDTKKSNYFESKGFIFVIPDITDSVLKERVDVYSSWYKDSCVIKKESELTQNDYKKHLWIVGKIADFRNWEKFSLPIIKTKSSFIFSNKLYSDKLDGISLIDTNRIAYVGNDNNCLFGIREPSYSNGFDFTITQNMKKTIFGNFINSYDSVFYSDLRLLRKNNYRCYKSKSMDIYVSYKIDSINVEGLMSEQDRFCSDFCSFYKLNSPKNKINAFFHKDQLEILMVSGYWDRCGGNIGGLAPTGEIHTKGISTTLISHEFGHKIFESDYGSNDNKPAYLSEGVIGCYFNAKKESEYLKCLTIACHKVEVIDYLSKFDERTKFDFKDDYSISAIFVKYIIDKYGVERLTKYYSQSEFVQSIKTIFDKSFDSFINDYKLWLENECKMKGIKN